MGKDRVIRIVAKQVANKVIHQILIKYTNKPESTSYLRAEENNYRVLLTDLSREYHWNDQDMREINKLALNNLEKTLNLKYSDVKVSKDELIQVLKENISEIFKNSSK
jgi:hypothetical protein